MKKRSLGNALRAAALAATVLLGACVGDGDEILSVNPTPNGGTLFTRYVALGNSITAGFQSGGINDSLQTRAYPVLLAQRAGTPFESPLIARPGCPRPFLAPLGSTGRLGTADSCTRINNPRITNNVAVPGERLRDLYVFPSGQLASLNTLLVGPRTQVRAMIEARPTFVSVWIGNNDALEATVGGILGPRAAGADSSLTQLSVFQSQLNTLVDSIKAAGPQGVMLVGVVNAIAAAPILQPGAYFYLAAQATGGSFQGKPVNLNCAPLTPLGTPNPLAANMVSFQIVGEAAFTEINCDPNAYPAGDPRRGAYLLDTQEQVIVSQRVAAFNAAIAAAAAANGWLYVDPNAILQPYLAEETTVTIGGQQVRLHQRLRKCQDLPTATTPAAIQAAIATSCPVTGATAAPNFFGSLMSFDGVHPSTEAHRVLAGAFADAINGKYGTSLSNART
ncbi:SGNH/GDSL hydrolase family protein [Longimicrobium sp.]|uniref:SGNH/GDSL hydrolase family protein n=1 Tax=Longimicrobium sp. TaxID=2029185 RepID=UPI003B3B8E21